MKKTRIQKRMRVADRKNQAARVAKAAVQKEEESLQKHSVCEEAVTETNPGKDKHPVIIHCRIDQENIRKALGEICEKLSTDEIRVECSEDTRKIDAGIIYYIVHIQKPGDTKVPTKKTGIYFTRIKGNIIHVQVINGTSMVPLFSNYSGNSQSEVFRYLENMIRKDMEFFQNALNARRRYQKPEKTRKDGNTKSYGGKKN